MRFIFLFFIGFTGLAQDIKNIQLLDQWSEDTLLTNSTNVRYSSCWGFEYEDREYAVIGSTEGSHFFELKADNKLKLIGFIKGKYSSSMAITREFKFYQHYIYAVCDEGPSSLQIIDMAFLPDSVVLVADLQNNLFGRTHNLFIDTTDALLYMCMVTPIVAGINLSMIPLCVFSLTDPINPTLLWQGPNDIQEVHDIYVRDNIAIMNCGYDGIRVYDFTQPSSPTYLNSLAFYNQQGYNHQGWLSPDKKTYVFTDETQGLKIKKCSVSDDWTITPSQFFGTSNSSAELTAHNVQITNNLAFVSYYNAGLRIYDLRMNPPGEIAAYDTYLLPDATNFTMWGAWGVYALYNSNRILVSDRNNGLFLFKFDSPFFENQSDLDNFTAYPNPTLSGQKVVIRSPNDFIKDFQYTVYDVQGKEIQNGRSGNNTFVELTMGMAAGIYLIELRYLDYFFDQSSSIIRIEII
jgi:choice-of-anchor B domain-containing protein